MANKTISARIQLKNDTEANWNKKTDFIPKTGEIIIYSIDESHPFSRLKVGDNYLNVIDLPFIDTGSVNGKTIQINTTAYWNARISYIPNAGDIIIYSDKKDNIPGIKIGDGLAYCVDLPFIGDDIMEILDSHISNTDIHITSTERNFWNNKLNYSIDGENLLFNRE